MNLKRVRLQKLVIKNSPKMFRSLDGEGKDCDKGARRKSIFGVLGRRRKVLWWIKRGEA